MVDKVMRKQLQIEQHVHVANIRPALQITKKGALNSQSQVIQFTSCLPMVGGSLRVLRLLPPLKLVAVI